jgi:bifunctional oligoribonuclease and PAP phosphatase NrnA
MTLPLSPDYIADIQDHLSRAKKILIVTHEFPDIDAIGSSLALYHQLLIQGYKVKIWTAQPLNHTFDFLPAVHNIVHPYPKDFDYDTVCVLDSSHFTRVRHHHKIPADDKTIINIDHHSDNSHFGDANLVLDISSVGELLFHLFKGMDWTITPEMATCLYAAISFDTGRFAYSNTKTETLLAASELIQAGANSYKIFQAMDENKNKADFDLMKLGFENCTTLDDCGIAYIKIPSQRDSESTIKLIDVIRQLGGYKVVLVFQEVDRKKVKVNLRSKSDFDVSAFAQRFGGGGHIMASGIFMEESLEDAEKMIIDALREEIESESVT